MDDEQSLLNELEPEETAAEAFARLDARIAAMDGRLALMVRAVEHLVLEKQAVDLPDYGATLAAMAEHLVDIRRATDRTSRSPLLQLTPEAYAAELGAAVEQLRKGDALTISEARKALNKAVADISHGRTAMRSAEAQRSQLRKVALLMALATTIVITIVPGIVVRGLPRSWGVPEYMATHMLGEATSWDAGSRLLRSDDEAVWRTLIEAALLWQENRDAIAACKKRTATSGRATGCVVQVSK